MYVWSLVAASGSRILIVAETRDVVEKLRAGGSAFDMVKEELMGNSGRDDVVPAAGISSVSGSGALLDPAAAAASYSGGEGADTFGYPAGKSGFDPGVPVDPQDPVMLAAAKEDGRKKRRQRRSWPKQQGLQRPPPWLGLSFEFRLPRLTVTWIHQSEVVRKQTACLSAPLWGA